LKQNKPYANLPQNDYCLKQDSEVSELITVSPDYRILNGRCNCKE